MSDAVESAQPGPGAEDARTGEPDISAHESAWRQGEWAALAALDLRSIEGHPRRARLALLASAGLAQTGAPDRAIAALRRAVAWGCTRDHAGAVLLSGAARSLGRAACLMAQDDRADTFFRDALEIGGSDPADAPMQRLAAENELGLLREGAERLRDAIVRDAAIATTREVADLNRRLGVVMEALRVRPDALTPPGRLHRSRVGFRLARPGQPFTVAVATAPRSGSTWLFNAVNRILDVAGIARHSAWCEEYDRAAHVQVPVHVVKLHEPRHLPATANLLVTTERALDERLASLLRMGWLASDPEKIRKAAAVHGTLSAVWLRLADCAVEYTELTGRPEAVVKRLAEAVEASLPEAEIAGIAAALAALSAPKQAKGEFGHDSETLMHPGHRAGPDEQARHLAAVRSALAEAP